jgi:hypothetical protein
MQCARHPSVETELACGKCGTPICPKCLVYTPVGARCGDCADVRQLPQFELSTGLLLRGAAAALLLGAGVGAIWGFLPFQIFFAFGLLGGLLLGAGIGFLIGEGVAAATNRKVGLPLQLEAACGVILAYLVRSAVLAIRVDATIFEILTLDTLGLVAVVVAVVVAVLRVR